MKTLRPIESRERVLLVGVALKRTARVSGVDVDDPERGSLAELKELAQSAGGARGISLPAIIHNRERAAWRRVVPDKWRGESDDQCPREREADDRGIRQNSSGLGVSVCQEETQNSAHRLAAEKDMLTLGLEPLVCPLGRRDPVLPSASVHIVQSGFVAGQQRAGHSVTVLMQGLRQWPHFGGGGRETVQQKDASGIARPEEWVALEMWIKNHVRR